MPVIKALCFVILFSFYSGLVFSETKSHSGLVFENKLDASLFAGAANGGHIGRRHLKISVSQLGPSDRRNSQCRPFSEALSGPPEHGARGANLSSGDIFHIF